MTVSELISKLAELPQDKQVILHDTCLDFWVKLDGIDPDFDMADNAIALQGSEAPEPAGWDDDED